MCGQIPLSPLLARFNPASLVVLLTAMLCERRIVFVSRNLPQLSACVHAAMSLLYPLEGPVRGCTHDVGAAGCRCPPPPPLITATTTITELHVLRTRACWFTVSGCVAVAFVVVHWQHLLIPIVPHSMLEYCAAPFPFVIGLRPSEFQALLEMRAGEVRPRCLLLFSCCYLLCAASLDGCGPLDVCVLWSPARASWSLSTLRTATSAR